MSQQAVTFGVVNSRIETVEEIEARIRQVLEHIEPDRLSVGPDCGMLYLNPDVARAKLTNLVSVVHRLREGL